METATDSCITDVETNARKTCLRKRETNRAAQKKYRDKLKEQEAALQKRVRQLELDLKYVLREQEQLEMHNQAMISSYRLHARSGVPDNEATPFVPANGFSAWQPLEARGGIKLTVMCHRHLPYSEALAFSLEDYDSIHNMIYAKARSLLDQNPTRSLESPAGKEMQALMLERHGVHAYLAGIKPLVMQKLLFDPRLKHAQPSDQEVWDRALEIMALRDDQKRFLAENKAIFASSLRALLDERTRLRQSIEALSCNCEFSRDLAAMQYKWAQLTQAFRDNVDKEHITICRFHAMLWKVPEGINAIQEAEMICAVYPHIPDCLALLEKLRVPDDRPVLLDADGCAFDAVVRPADRLPDPAVDRYLPMPDKLLAAIGGSRLYQQDPKEKPTQQH